MKRRRSGTSHCAQSHLLTCISKEPELLYKMTYWIARQDPSDLLHWTRVFQLLVNRMPWLRPMIRTETSPFDNCWTIGFIYSWPNEMIRLYEYDYQVRLRQNASHRGLVQRLIEQAIDFVYPTYHSAQIHAPELFLAGESEMVGNQYFHQTRAASIRRSWIFTHDKQGSVTPESKWPVVLCKARRLALLLFHAWAQETVRHLEQHSTKENDVLLVLILPDMTPDSAHDVSRQENDVIFAARIYALQLEFLLNAYRGRPVILKQLWSLDYFMPQDETLERLNALKSSPLMESYKPTTTVWWKDLIQSTMQRVDKEIPYPNNDFLSDHLCEMDPTLRLDPVKYNFMYETTTRLVYRRLIEERDSTLMMQS